jgi:adenylyltransferase/sulfurtransferase
MAQNRYHRQEILKHFGPEGQKALSLAHVLVIGAGGLGCPVLQYLAAAGVGRITVVDDDIVDISNLHRQVLFGMGDIGRSKAEVAAAKCRALNPEVSVTSVTDRFDKHNAFSLMRDCDIVADCSDNFGTRYMVNDACVINGKPLVYGAVSRFEGQVAVFNVKGSGHYRDLFPEMPDSDEVNNCAEAGVLGVLPGVIGSLMATEVIKYIAGTGQLLTNQLLTYNALRNDFLKITYSPIANNPSSSPITNSPIPATEAQFLNTDYSVACSRDLIFEPGVLVVDVREQGELPEVKAFDHIQIPLGEIAAKVSELRGKRVVTFCKSGIRSEKAARILRELGVDAYHVVLDLESL